MKTKDLTDRFLKRHEEQVINLNQMNRAGRRAMGFRGPIDPEWVQHEASQFVPRFVRRHFAKTIDAHLRTRRQRKARAHIIRLMAGRMPS